MHPENQSIAAGELIGSCPVFFVVVVFHSFVFRFRFMLQWPGVRILRRNELDAFLAQALSPKLYEPDQLQELKVIVWRLLYVECPGNTHPDPRLIFGAVYYPWLAWVLRKLPAWHRVEVSFPRTLHISQHNVLSA